MEAKTENHEREVRITVNGKPVLVPHETTGAEIKKRAGVDTSWQLFVIRGDHEVEVTDGERVHVRPNEKFIATPTLDPS